MKKKFLAVSNPMNGKTRFSRLFLNRTSRDAWGKSIRLSVVWGCGTALAFVAGPLFLAANESDEFAALKVQYDQKVGEFALELGRQKSEGLTKYRVHVSEALQRAQASGNLEATKRLIEEGKRVEGGPLDLAALEKHEVPEIANLRQALRQVYERADRRFQEQQSTLIRQYLRPLERLKPQLVTQGNLDAAERVDAEIRIVTQTLAKLDGSLRRQGGLRLPAVLERGLVAHFDFDKQEDDQTTGSSRGDYVGLLQGSQWVESGKLGGAFSFDGVDDQITLTKELPDSKELSFSVWVNYQGQSGDGGIFSDWGPAGGNDLMFGLKGPGGVFVRADKSGEKLNASLSLGKNVSGDWHHLVWTMSSAQSVIYLDGVQVDEVRTGGSNVGHHGAVIGAAHDGTAHTRFRGMLDEVMIWSRVLTAREVADLNALLK